MISWIAWSDKRALILVTDIHTWIHCNSLFACSHVVARSLWAAKQFTTEIFSRCGKFLCSSSSAINNTFSALLDLWKDKSPVFGHDKIHCVIREKVYDAMSEWIKVKISWYLYFLLELFGRCPITAHCISFLPLGLTIIKAYIKLHFTIMKAAVIEGEIRSKYNHDSNERGERINLFVNIFTI